MKKIIINDHNLTDEDMEQVVVRVKGMIINSKGKILLAHNNNTYQFPGGHLEDEETLDECITREMKEETGLNIKNPKLTGIYHWMTDDIRNIGYLYKATEFEGELISSEEGKVYWISGEEFLQKPLAPGMLQVWKMMHDENANECLQTLTADGEIISKIQ